MPAACRYGIIFTPLLAQLVVAANRCGPPASRPWCSSLMLRIAASWTQASNAAVPCTQGPTAAAGPACGSWPAVLPLMHAVLPS